MGEKMDIKVSVIIPVYNSEKYLEECIESLLGQTLKECEFIFVNDGSKDNSYNILKKYEKLDRRIKIINQKNQGSSMARNSGLNIARGKYIGFIDSDDYIDKDMISILYNNIIKNEADISICDYYEVYSNEKKIERVNCDNVEVVMNNTEALNKIYEEKGWLYVVAWNKLYKKELFENIKFMEGKIHEDEIIAHELLYNAKRIVYTNKKLYYYLQRKDSIMGESFNIKKLDIIDALKYRADFFHNKKIKNLQYKAEYEYLKKFFSLYYKAELCLKDYEVRLKSIKKGYNKIFFRLIKNPYYNLKEKMMMFIFFINPKMYKKIIK